VDSYQVRVLEVDVKEAPKDKVLLARFKDWHYWTAVEWDEEKQAWSVVGHAVGRWFPAEDILYWEVKGEVSRVT